MTVRSTIWISGTPGQGPRLIIADAVGDVDPLQCMPGDRLLSQLGESYEVILTGTVLSWGGDGGAGIVPGTVAIIDGPVLTAAARAEAIPAANKITLPANWWRVGRCLRIRFAGRISSVITTPGTGRFDVAIGAVAAFDTQAILLDDVAAHVTVPFAGEIFLVCRSIGAAAQLMGSGYVASQDIVGVAATQPKGGPVAVVPWAANPALGTAFDSTVAGILDFMFTQTVATGSMTLTQYVVEALN